MFSRDIPRNFEHELFRYFLPTVVEKPMLYKSTLL